jgi:hypothetical protein
MRRVLCDAIIARLARFPIELSHYLGRGLVFWIECGRISMTVGSGSS